MKATVTDIVEVEPGVFSILIDGASYEARMDGDFVTVCGEVFLSQVQDPQQWRRSLSSHETNEDASIVAAMPGKVIRVLTRVDDVVEAGQGLVIVEAMKMQNELKAPRAGRVSALRVREGESVHAGAVLAILSR